MFNFAVHRKFVNTNTGRRVLLRPLLQDDAPRLENLFRNAPEDDTRFLKDDVRDLAVLEKWTANLNYAKVLPLVACVDDRIVGDCSLHLGRKTTRHLGVVRIFLSPDFRGVGLGSKMIQEVEEVAQKLGLKFLMAEVILDHVGLIKAFRRLGFDLRSTLDDYYMAPDGKTFDVAFLVKRLTKQEFTF
jgi:RimJ/RimL family protein N-acetyltransferase